MNRKTVSKFIALSAVCAVMAVSLAGCGQEDTAAVDPEYVEQLESECVDLRTQNQNLENQLGDLEQTIVLKSHSLKAVPNAEATGASVQMTASPMRLEEGQKALFRVSLGGEEVFSQEGTLKDGTYTATAELEAADGYTYECIVTQADGSESTVILSSPDAPLYESCVYLAASLNAYCNLFVEDWIQADGKLTLLTGYAQVQLPRIGGRTVDYQSSDLVLRLGDAELQRVALDLPQGEAEGSYEMILQNVDFDMPEIEEEQQLDLWLEVTLDNGKSLTYNGCSWFYADGNLILAVG